MPCFDGTSRIREVLTPVTRRIETLESRFRPSDEDIFRIKAAARLIGIRGVRYGLLLALLVVSPKDAIKRVLNAIDAAQDDCEQDGPTADDMA